MPRLLYLFSLCNLVVGSSAFVVSGLVEPIARDLGVGLAAVGQAMTVYALVTALAVPVLVAFTARWPRRRALLLALGLFATGNLICMAAGSIGSLLLGRAVMGLGAMFTPLAAGLALVLAPAERRGQALSLVFLGMSLSYVVGVPAGAWIGSHYGWQAAVGTGAAATLLLGGVLALAVPRDLQAPAPGLSGLGEALRDREVITVLVTTLLYFVAIFAVFSYIGAVLRALVPLTAEGLSLTLMLFGVAGVTGTLLGGAANDRFGPHRTMAVLLPALALMMALLPLTAGHPGLMLAVLMGWGVAGFGLMAPQQSRLAQRAPRHAALLLSLNTSMLYAGTALGAVVGGLAIGALGPGRLAWAAAPFALAACVLLWSQGPAAAAPRRA